MTDQKKCDGCGEVWEDEARPHFELRRAGSVWLGDDLNEKHFCGVECLGRWVWRELEEGAARDRDREQEGKAA